jgi:hypothetical protein
MRKVTFAQFLLLCFIPYSITFAQNEDGTSDFDTLVTQYNLIPISQVPAGIELIVI